MMTRPLRLLVATLVALGTIGISTAHPTDAAGGNVADCSFSTLQTDLQAGGDWYYTAGQCTSPIVFTSTIAIGPNGPSNVSLTAQGNDVILDGGGNTSLFGVNVGKTFGLTGLTLSHGAYITGLLIGGGRSSTSARSLSPTALSPATSPLNMAEQSKTWAR